MKTNNAKLKYLFYKTISFFLPRSCFGSPVAPGIIQVNKINKPEKVVFILDDPLYVHLGDQMFCAPAIIALQNAGIKVETVLTGDIPEFWKINNVFPQKFAETSFERACYFTYMPMLFSRDLKNKSGYTIAFNDSGIRERVSVHLCHEVCKLFDVKFDKVPPLKLPETMDSKLKQQLLDLGNNVWFLGDQLVSGFYRWSHKKRKLLWEKAKELAANGGKVVYLKGEKDELLPLLIPEAVSLDLRGRTSPDDIIGAMQLPNVKGIISFDNFLMHICLLCNKKAFVLFRGRYSRQQREHCFEKVNLAFEEVKPENIEYLQRKQ